jgi:cell division protein FtsB
MSTNPTDSSSQDVPQSSLTAPNDRTDKMFRIGRQDDLSREQTTDAMNDLLSKDVVRNYPASEKAFADPSIPGQRLCLVSFVPSVDATPDKDGVYGMIKVRGSYETEDEADARAETLIRTVDSYHKIFTAFVGKPFPATTSSRWSADTNEIDIKKKVTEVISKDIKKQRQEEKKEIEEIKEREKKLMEDVEKDFDPYERYIELRVKKAQLAWTYLETQKKMDEMKQSIIKTREEIAELDEENPDYLSSYREKYMSARRDAGLKDDDASFLSYLSDEDEKELDF